MLAAGHGPRPPVPKTRPCTLQSISRPGKEGLGSSGTSHAPGSILGRQQRAAAIAPGQGHHCSRSDQGAGPCASRFHSSVLVSLQRLPVPPPHLPGDAVQRVSEAVPVAPRLPGGAVQRASEAVTVASLLPPHNCHSRPGLADGGAAWLAAQPPLQPGPLRAQAEKG